MRACADAPDLKFRAKHDCVFLRSRMGMPQFKVKRMALDAKTVIEPEDAYRAAMN